MKPILIVIFLLLFVTSKGQRNKILLPAKDGDLWGYIDKSGNWLIKPQYTQCSNFDNRLFTWVIKNGESLLINKKGEIQTSLQVSNVTAIYENIVIYAENGLYGWYNRSTKSYFQPIYKDLKYIFETQQFIFQDSLFYGIISENGAIIAAPQYNTITPIDSFYTITINEKKGLLSSSGEIVIPAIYNELTLHPGFIVTRDSVDIQHVFDSEGTYRFGGKYSRILYLTDGFFSTIKSDVTYLINGTNGKVEDSLARYYNVYSGSYISINGMDGIGMFSTIVNRIILNKEYLNIYSQVGSSNFIANKDGSSFINVIRINMIA